MALALKKATIDTIVTMKWFTRSDFRKISTLHEKNLYTKSTSEHVDKKRPTKRSSSNPAFEFRHIYPEFLPNPNAKWRNSLREKLERADMLKRRNQIDIPEFHVGSILAVIIFDPHAQSKNRFVGICIDRQGCGLSAQFTLRNIIDHQDVEVRYDLYDPAIQIIQVLRLEKRLEDKLKETSELKGVSNIEKHSRERTKIGTEFKRPWEKYDLMKQYRTTTHEEDQREIWDEVLKHLVLKKKRNVT